MNAPTKPSVHVSNRHRTGRRFKSYNSTDLFGTRLTSQQAGACPVCQKKGCTQWSGGAVNCITYRQGQKDDVIGSYTFIKTDAVGLGLWKPTPVATASSNGRKLTKAEADIVFASAQKLKKQKSGIVAAAPKKVSLALRDEQLREWAFNKGLHPAHRTQQLERRGLNEAQIDSLIANGLVWTIGWGDNPAHDQIPGGWDRTDKNGKQRVGYGGAIGMAIACRQYTKSGESLYVGAQIATEKAFVKKNGGKGKYLWLSHPENNTRIPKHKANPITVHRTGEQSTHAVVCEGMLKSLLAVQRQDDHGIDLGAAVIAAAGTIWGSKGVFSQIKEQAELLGVREIRMAMDAGAPQNPDVMRGVAKFAKACFSAGFLFRVIWYGQFEKSVGDIDELDIPPVVELLSLAEVQRREAEAAKLRPEDPTKKTKEEEEKPEAYPLTATEGFQEDYGYLPHRAGQLIQEILSRKLTCLRSGCGTGKTQLAKMIVEIAHEQNRPVFLVVHRLRLGESLGSQFGLPLKYEVKQMGDYLGFAITADSSHPRSGMRFDGRSIPKDSLLVLDEVDQVFWHMCHGQTAIADYRDEVVEHVSAAMFRAENILALSADLSDREADLIEACIGGLTPEQKIRIVNTHKRKFGDAKRYSSAYELIHKMQSVLGDGRRFMAKLSGQKNESIMGTKVLGAWLAEMYPDKRGVIFDSESLKTLTMETAGIDYSHVPEGLRKQPILEYLSPPDDTEKAKRQAYFFESMDWVLFTNACSTGVSFEAGNFTDFFQIEQGKGSVYDALQSTARYRPTNIERHIYVAPRGMGRIGNGATSPERLKEGNDQVWARQIMALANAGCDWLSFSSIEYLSPVGRVWSNYSRIRTSEFNAHSYEYADTFYELLEEAGYEVSVGFNGEWMAMSKKEQIAFKNKLKANRDLIAAQANKAEALQDVDGANLPELLKKRVATAEELRQIAKLRVMERYGVTADEVTPEMLAADKAGIYRKLLLRLYLELGLEKAAEDDKAAMSIQLNKGRMWSLDVLKKANAHRVSLLEELGVPEILTHLRTIGEDGLPNSITKESPLLKEFIKKAIDCRGEVKQSLGSTVGRVTLVKEDDGHLTEVCDVERPIAILQTILKRLCLNVVSVGQKTVDGSRVHKFQLVDVIDPSIDYKRFKSARLAAAGEVKLKEVESPTFARNEELAESIPDILGGLLKPNWAAVEANSTLDTEALSPLPNLPPTCTLDPNNKIYKGYSDRASLEPGASSSSITDSIPVNYSAPAAAPPLSSPTDLVTAVMPPTLPSTSPSMGRDLMFRVPDDTTRAEIFSKSSFGF